MKLSIAAKLALGFAVVVVLALGGLLFQLNEFRHAVRFLEEATERDAQVTSMSVNITLGRMEVRGFREGAFTLGSLAVIRRGPPLASGIEGEYRRHSDALIARMVELEEYARNRAEYGLTEQRRILWAEIATAAGAMLRTEVEIATLAQGLFQFLRQGRLEEAVAQRDLLLPLHRRIDQNAEAVVTGIGRLTLETGREMAAVYRRSLRAAIAVGVAMLAAATVAAVIISRKVSGPISRFVEFVRVVGQGDLTRRLPTTTGDEMATLAHHLNQMTESLGAIARDTRAGAEAASAAVSEIRAAAQEQVAAASEQVSAIEETSATLTEITKSGSLISRRAEEVERTGRVAAGAADDGLKAVEDTGRAMDAIREQAEALAATVAILSTRAQAIADIILTVNTIAERSHLLALNAAIEAAAAGEHGRSFAVVAEEIKKLAGQARDANAQVRTQLGGIQEGVNAAVGLTGEAGKRLTAGRQKTGDANRTILALADGIRESVLAFQQIMAATNQHQIGLEQSLQALQSIREASRQTADTTRELERSAMGLGSLSETLLNAVKNYRL
jgi:methyl-accepting chemotaxis protein